MRQAWHEAFCGPYFNPIRAGGFDCLFPRLSSLVTGTKHRSGSFPIENQIYSICSLLCPVLRVLGLLRVFSAKRFQKYSENSQHLTGKRIPILLKTWPSEQQASVQVISGGFGLFIFFSKFLDWIFNILVKHTVAKFAKSPLIFLTAFKTVFSPEKLGF